MRSIKAFTISRLAGALLGATALLCSSGLTAQNSSVAPRITTDVNELSRMTLRGNVPSLARAEFDQGEAEPSTQLTHMRLVLSRSSEQQAALDAYLAQLQDKSSPNYHKGLTPEQFGQLYGPVDSDLAALVAWLESHGLTVETISPGRTNIAFNGTVNQVEEAFHTSIHSFLLNQGQDGEQQFYSNTLDPQIPSALAAVVKGIAHLNTIHPRPHNVRGSMGTFNPGTRRMELANAVSANGARPNFTTGSGTTASPYTLWMVPGDAATIYDTPNSFNANFTSGTSYTGAGVKIGIGGDAAINASIVADYRSMFLGNSTQPILNYCTSSNSCSTTPGYGYIASDADEAYLDTELSGGMAPGATIYYYASPDLDTGIDAAITANVVDIFSLSFGECELDNGSSENALINGFWEQAATQLIAVTVSAGDSGSAGCDYPSTNSGGNVPDAVGGLAVSGYASTPYNIAVGGTDFYTLWTTNAVFEQYVNLSNEGTSSNNYDYYRTALSYIPESTWNDSSFYDTTISADVPLSDAGQGYPTSDNNIVAGSGGASTIYSRPTWQTGTGTFDSGGMRDLPDVSLMSGNGFDSATWLVCTADTERVSGTTYTENCTTQNGSFYFSGFGGTSTAAPAFAGIMALVQQKYGSRLGQAATELYALYNGSHSSAIFHDVTVGNNSVPCNSSTPNCVDNTAGYYFESGYNTTTGYDLATGLGSVDATQLVKYWSSGTGSATASVGVTVNTAQPVTTVEIISVTVTVSGASGTPTGTVSMTSGSYNSGVQTLNGSGGYTFSIPAGSLAIGSDTLTVNYNGNSTYATANNTAPVTVNGLAASVTATPSPSIINSNQTVTVTGTVSGTDGTPTGTVTLTGGGYTSAATALVSGGYSITIPYNSLSAGPDTLTVTYSGNSIYDAGATGTASVTVTYFSVATPTVTVTPASSSMDSSQTLSVTVTVSGASSLESSPTGTVTLTSGSYTSGAQTLASSGSCTAALCTIIIPANSLSNSQSGSSDTLTATYSGDPYYVTAQKTASVTVTTSAFALAATTPAAIAPGASAASTITVTSGTLYSGTVRLTCVLTSPTSVAHAPSCAMSSTTLQLLSGVPSPGQVAATVSTTAATSVLAYPRLPGKGRGWEGAGGGAVLAFLLFLGIPARRRGWRSMLGILVVMAALGSLSACGGGSSTSTTTTTTGTTPDTYTFTVTATGTPSVAPAPSVTFSVVVN
jgi:subtilase family serine protease